MIRREYRSFAEFCLRKILEKWARWSPQKINDKTLIKHGKRWVKHWRNLGFADFLVPFIVIAIVDLKSNLDRDLKRNLKKV